MNPSSPLNSERLRPYLRVVVLAAWLGWGALALLTLFVPADPERRAPAVVALVASAVYIFLFSRFLVLRYHAAAWFPLALGASSVLMLFVLAQTFPLLLPTVDAGLTVVLLFVLLIGSRRAAIVTGLLGSLSVAALEWGRIDTLEWLYGLLDRTLIYIVLAVLFSEALEWSARAWRESTALAEQATRQTERQLRELRALHDLATAIGSSLDLQHVLDLAMTKTLAVFRMEGALIALIDEESRSLVLTAQSGLPQELADRIAHKPLPVGQGLSGQVAADGRPLFSEDLGSDPRAANPDIAEFGYKAYFCFALKAGSQIFGVMNVLGFDRRAPDANELAFLEALGEQVGLAVQRAQSYAALQKQRALAESFGRVAQVVGEGHDLSAPLDTILAELAAVVPYASAAIMLVEERMLRVSAARGHPAGASSLNTRFPVDGEIVLGDVLRSGAPVVLQDTQGNPRWLHIPGYEYIRSWVGAPLLHQGTAIGVLTVDRAEPNAFHADEIQLLSTFATQAAAAIDKARLFRQANRRLAQLSALNQVGQAIGAELDLTHVLQLVHTQVGALTGNEDFYIALYDERTDEVSFPIFYERGQSMAIEPRRHGHGMTEAVIRSRQPLMLNDDISAWNLAHGIELIGMPSHSWMGVPLLKGEKVIGVMTVQNYEQPYAYDAEDLELFRTLAGQVAVALENARLYADTQRNLRAATVLFEFSRKVAQSADPAQIALAAAHACRAAFPDCACTVYGYADESALLLPLAFVSDAAALTGEQAALHLEALTGAPLPPPFVLAVVEPQRGPAVSAAQGDTRICLPITLQERVLGALFVEELSPPAFDETDRRFLESLCGQLGVALEGARLKRSEERRTRELSSLYEVSQAFGAMGDPYATYAEITRRLAQIFHAQGAVVLLYDATQHTMQAQAPAFGAPDAWVRQVRFSLDERFLNVWNPHRESSLIVNDPMLLPKGFQSVIQRYELHHLMGAAMFGRQGLMGLLFVANRADRRPFNDADGQLLAVLAHQAALAIENSRLVETERASRQQLAVINQVGQKVSATLEVNELLTELTSFIREHLHYHALAFYFVEGDEVVAQNVVGGLQGEVGFRQPVSSGVLGWVVRNRAPRLANDTQLDPEFIDPSGSGLRSELAVPLIARGEVIGVISAASDVPNRFSESDVVLLSTIADQVAQGIYDARLYQSERQGRQRLQLVNRIARRILSLHTLQGLVQEIATAVEETFHYEVVQTMLVEGEELVKRGGAGRLAQRQSAEYRQSVQVGIFGFAARTGTTYVANDVEHDPLYVDALHLGIRAEAAIPLRAEDKVIGLLVAASERAQAFSASDITTLETVADQAAQAIVNVRFYEAEQRRANQLATISHFGREIASLLNLDELLKRAVHLIHERFGYYAVHIFLVNPDGVTSTLALGIHQGNVTESGTVTLQIGKQGLIGKAIGENCAICENDVTQNPDYHAEPSFTFIRSELVVPIRHGDRVLGALDAQDDRLNAFSEDDQFVLQTLADQLAVAIANAELHMAVEQQAHTDSLTGVYNHGYLLRCLNAELAHAERTGQPLALIMLDIDYFKQYNDRYGHVVGDWVLQLIAQAIRQNIKHEDLVGRWGGEEFAIALPNTSAPQGMIVAERIRRTLAAMELRDNTGGPIEKPTISQGLAAFPDHAGNAEALVDRADRMLYRAKEHGRDQVVLYQMQMKETQ